jgi:hypothetical protein
MQVSKIQWSTLESKVAKQALKIARHREVDTLISEVRNKAGELAAADDLWNLHDFLSAQRHYIDGKYDDDETGLVFVLARLVKEGWLAIEELDGLDDERLAKITALARFL